MKPALPNGKYSLKKFIETHNKMLKLSSSPQDKTRALLKEKILYLTECQIWGDKYDDLIFEYISHKIKLFNFYSYFCENQMLEEYYKLLTRRPHREIIIQIIQSIGMLLYNLSKPTSVNYLLSNNLINEFIDYDYNFNDDEILDYYISFLKSLALRMASNPVQLFFNQKHKTFPLLSKSVRFFDHKENMVRTSVRNITLTIFKSKIFLVFSFKFKNSLFFHNFYQYSKILLFCHNFFNFYIDDDVNIQEFLLEYPFIMYFVQVGQYLGEVWIEMNTLIEDYKY